MEQMTATKDGTMADKVDQQKNQTKMQDRVASRSQGEWKEVTPRKKSPRKPSKLVIDTSARAKHDIQTTKGRKRRKEITPRSSGEVVNKRVNTSVVVKQEMMDDQFPPLVQATNKVIIYNTTQNSDVDGDNLDGFVDAVPFSGDDDLDTVITAIGTQEKKVEHVHNADSSDDELSHDSDDDADRTGSGMKETNDEQQQKYKDNNNNEN